MKKVTWIEAFTNKASTFEWVKICLCSFRKSHHKNKQKPLVLFFVSLVFYRIFVILDCNIIYSVSRLKDMPQKYKKLNNVFPTSISKISHVLVTRRQSWYLHFTLLFVWSCLLYLRPQGVVRSRGQLINYPRPSPRVTSH